MIVVLRRLEAHY